MQGSKNQHGSKSVETREVSKDGSIIYRDQEGRPHRENGPAVIHLNGTVYWCAHGVIHRALFPGGIMTDGARAFFLHNQLVMILSPDK